METNKMQECTGVSSGATVTIADRSSPVPVESLRKKAKFSISSILGEEDKNNENVAIKAGVLLKDEGTEQSDSSKDNVSISPGPPVTSGSIRIPPEAAKYNAFLAQFANPDVAKLYRWPLFWNPWMGMQNTTPSGVPRPGLIQQPPFMQSSMRPEGNKILSETEDNKDSLEAGEIVRPIAFRRPIPEPHLFYKNGFPEDIHIKNARGHSPGPLIEGRRDHDMDFKFGDERKNTSFSESDPNNELVEIEVDEADDSDNEGENADSRHGDDGLKGSNCERKKKTRTVFSRSQIFQLETMFDMKRYLSSSERAGLAKALNMTETQVKIWFQNRRNKWKRQIAAEMEAANMSQVAGQRLMQLPYMYSHDEISRGLRSSLPISPVHSGHPIVPPSVHHYYGGILRSHNS